MANFKEIVTKAVIGKAKKSSTGTFTVSPDEKPDTVLGCWVINHNFRGNNSNGQVGLNGEFDVNVWYSYDNDTKTTVKTQRFSYNDRMNMSLKDDSALTDSSEIIVRSLKQPTVSNVEIENGQVKLSIDKELGVEIVGDTKIRVSVEDEFEDYEEIVDDLDESEVTEMMDQIDQQVNDKYL